MERTIAYICEHCLQFEMSYTICAAAVVVVAVVDILFYSIPFHSVENRIEQKTRPTRYREIWIDFLGSSDEIKSRNKNQEKYEKFSHLKQFRPKIYFKHSVSEKNNNKKQTPRGVDTTATEKTVNYIFETIKLDERK